MVKIYTRSGDNGDTSSFRGERIPKDSLEVEVYGDLDELLAFLGLAYTKISSDKIKKEFEIIFNDLHNLIADISDSQGTRLTERQWKYLEERIDSHSKILKPLKTFILEISSEDAAYVNVARTVCRRAERKVVALSKSRPLNPNVLSYLNRLSDYLFIVFRYLHSIGDYSEETYEPYESDQGS